MTDLSHQPILNMSIKVDHRRRSVRARANRVMECRRMPSPGLSFSLFITRVSPTIEDKLSRDGERTYVKRHDVESIHRRRDESSA